MKDILKKIGLTENEIEIYLMLLSLSSASASNLSYRTGIAKTSCRYLCDQLITKKLIWSKKQGNTLIYVAESPEKIMFLLEEEEREVQEKKEGFNRILSKLIAINDPDTVIPKVDFYEGIEGVKHVYEDTLTEGISMIHAFENAEPMTDELKEYVFNNYIPRRAKKNIFIKLIAPNNEFHKKTRSEDSIFMRETRFFSPDIIPIDIEINLYGNKSAFFSYREEEMFAVILESKSITNSLKQIFNFCWTMAT